MFSLLLARMKDQQGNKYLARWSFIEIYNEDIHDLLAKDPNKKKAIKEDPNMGVFVKDVTMFITKSVDDLKKALIMGSKNRKKGETLMNRDSSRSHWMFTLYVETQETIANKEKIKVGKLNLVDLAGSERQKKSGAANERLKEASNINLSLTSLMNVISALVDPKKKHIPYRDSKLTRLLEDSLGGNTKTWMIANISPADYNFEETMSTLRYANRAKNIKNQPKINEDPKDALLREYIEEIKRLKEMLSNIKDIKPQSPKNSQSKPPSPKHNSMAASHVSSHRDSELELSNSSILSNSIHRYSLTSSSKPESSPPPESSKDPTKVQLETALKDLEEKLAQSNIKVQEQEIKKMQEYRDLQLKLEEEKQIREKLLHEKLRKEEEMIMVERDYKSLQEEVDEQRKLIRVLRNKYKDAVDEIKDLGEEANNEREYLRTAMMEINKEMMLYKAILHVALSWDEIDRIVSKSKFSTENKVWKVPQFLFRQQKLNFGKTEGKIQDLKMKERNETKMWFVRDEDEGAAMLPPAVPGSVSPGKRGFQSNWNVQKSGNKSLADFSNERNVVNKSEYYIGLPQNEEPKFKIVRKLTNSGSGVRLAPITPIKDVTDSSVESNSKSSQQQTKIPTSQSVNKIVNTVKKPIDIENSISDSEETDKQKVKKKEKLKIKSKKLFSRGKETKKTKVQRIGKMISYIELYKPAE